jgi:hypothetical protein
MTPEEKNHHYYNSIPRMSLDIKNYQNRISETVYVLYVRGDVLSYHGYGTTLQNYDKACFGVSKKSAVPENTTTQSKCSVYDDYNVYLFTIRSSDNLVNMIIDPNNEHIVIDPNYEAQLLGMVFYNGLYVSHMKTALNYDKHTINIFNVCIPDLSNRGKGYASILFNSAKNRMDTTVFTKLWLGVLLNNPSFKCAVSLYTKYGFVLSDSLCEFNGEPYISMEWSNNQNTMNTDVTTFKDKVTKALQKRREVRKLNNKTWCRQYVYMDPQMANCLQTYQRNPSVEYAGKLSIVPSNVKDDIHILVPSELVRGDPSSVRTPVSAINFHTHPEICYTNFGCDSGWPSAPDSYYILSNFKEILAHLVIAREGFYIIKVNLEAKDYLEHKDDNAKSIINTVVFIYFAILEEERKNNSLPPEVKIIEYFLQKTDQVTLLQMATDLFEYGKLRNVNEYQGPNNTIPIKYIKDVIMAIMNANDNILFNFKPFSIQFVYWKQLETQGGMVFDIFFPADNGNQCEAKKDADTAPDNGQCAKYENVDMTDTLRGGRYRPRQKYAANSKKNKTSKKKLMLV